MRQRRRIEENLTLNVVILYKVQIGMAFQDNSDRNENRKIHLNASYAGLEGRKFKG